MVKSMVEVSHKERGKEGEANLVVFTRSGIVILLQNCQNKWKWDKRRENLRKIVLPSQEAKK